MIAFLSAISAAAICKRTRYAEFLVSKCATNFVALGMGIEIANFTIDMTVAENLLYTGTYIISGNTQNLSSKIAVGYDF